MNKVRRRKENLKQKIVGKSECDRQDTALGNVQWLARLHRRELEPPGYK